MEISLDKYLESEYENNAVNEHNTMFPLKESNSSYDVREEGILALDICLSPRIWMMI